MSTDRKALHQKKVYMPQSAMESFIVPRLNEAISFYFSQLSQNDNTGKKILDIGCGAQPFRERLEALNFEYHSIDVVQNHDGTVEFLGQIDKPIPEALLKAGPFDLIVCTEVLEHVADWHQAFSNFNKMLKVGGEMLITCPHYYVLHEVPYDFWRPTIYALEYYSSSYGFKVKEAKELGSAWDVLGTILSANFVTNKNNILRTRVYSWVIRKFFSWIVIHLRENAIQKNIDFNNMKHPTYISNYILLSK